MDCSPLGFSVHGLLQARILEWSCHSLLQGIFPTQGSNPGLLHWQVDYVSSEPPGKPGKSCHELSLLIPTTQWEESRRQNTCTYLQLISRLCLPVLLASWCDEAQGLDEQAGHVAPSLLFCGTRCNIFIQNANSSDESLWKSRYWCWSSSVLEDAVYLCACFIIIILFFP